MRRTFQSLYRLRQARSGESVAAAIREAGGQAEAVELDFAEPASIPLLFNRAEEIFGPVDVLVNNAAYNVVSPGPIQTGYIPPEAEPGIVETIPMGRLSTPEDVADVIVFLASEQARWVTGQVLHVGGGHRM